MINLLKSYHLSSLSIETIFFSKKKKWNNKDKQHSKIIARVQFCIENLLIHKVF